MKKQKPSDVQVVASTVGFAEPNDLTLRSSLRAGTTCLVLARERVRLLSTRVRATKLCVVAFMMVGSYLYMQLLYMN